MKKFILLFVFIFLTATTGFAKDIWKSIEYHHSSGPISLRYQYVYTITVNSDRTGMIKYVKPTSGGADTVINFKVSKKMMSRLNYAIKKSQVITVLPVDMESSQKLIGGPVNTVKLTIENTNNNSTSTLQYPNFIIDAYHENMDKLYTAVHDCVPQSVWTTIENMPNGL